VFEGEQQLGRQRLEVVFVELLPEPLEQLVFDARVAPEALVLLVLVELRGGALPRGQWICGASAAVRTRD